jgi:hypothetical protein
MPSVIGRNATIPSEGLIQNAFAGFSVTGTQIGGSQNAPITTLDKDKLLNNQCFMLNW